MLIDKWAIELPLKPNHFKRRTKHTHLTWLSFNFSFNFDFNFNFNFN